MVSSVAEAGDSSANNNNSSSSSSSSSSNNNNNNGGIKSRAVDETSGAIDEALNELAVKVALEQLGCAVGVVLRGCEVAAIANMGVPILLEIASDEVKELVYARRGIHTGRVVFTARAHCRRRRAIVGAG
jgi:hypothetical protein